MFKKMLFCLLVYLGLILPVMADGGLGFTYKVYNPKTNQFQIVTLGTLGMGDNRYIWGFFTPEGVPVCAISWREQNTDPEGKIGGKCCDVALLQRTVDGEHVPESQFAKYEMRWREMCPNTFYMEYDAIKGTRTRAGMIEMSK